jgi:hypothetical protein
MCTNKQGLPILLTRYAIAPAEAKAPEVNSGFIAPTIKLEAAAHYTQRLLRSGYVYQYNVATKKWKGYIVLENAYLMPFNIGKNGPEPIPASVSDKDRPCEPEKDGAIAGCVTIPYSELGELWFAFSDVEWTQPIWQKHVDNKGKNMRKVNVKAWRDGAEAPHATGIQDVAKHVVEYAAGVNKKGFDFSHADFSERPRCVDFSPLAAELGVPAPALFEAVNENKLPSALNQTPAGQALYTKAVTAASAGGKSLKALLSNRLESPSVWLFHGLARLDPNNALPADKKGMILALEDPAGITWDLAELMDAQLKAFHAQKTGDGKNDYARKLMCNAHILHLRDVVYETAQTDLIEKKKPTPNSETWKRQQKYLKTLPHAKFVGELDQHWEAPMDVEQKKRYDELGKPTAEELDKVAEDLWQTKYVKDGKDDRYNEVARAEFEKTYKEELTKFNTDYIAPLANAHYEWMKSDSLLNNFNDNYDFKVPPIGMLYTQMISWCIGSTADMSPCMGLYSDWLDEEKVPRSDSRNLLGRALLLGRDDLAELLEQALPGLLKSEKKKEAEKEAQKETNKPITDVAKKSIDTEKKAYEEAGAKLLKKYKWSALIVASETALADAFVTNGMSHKISLEELEKAGKEAISPAKLCEQISSTWSKDAKTPLDRLFTQIRGLIAKKVVVPFVDVVTDWLMAIFYARHHTALISVELTETKREIVRYIAERRALDAWKARNDNRLPNGATMSEIREGAQKKINLLDAQAPGQLDVKVTRTYRVAVPFKEYVEGGRGSLSYKQKISFMRGMDSGKLYVTTRQCLQALDEGRWDDVFERNGSLESDIDRAKATRARYFGYNKTFARTVVPAGFGGFNAYTAVVAVWTAWTTLSKTNMGSAKRRVCSWATFAGGIADFIGSMHGLAETALKNVRFMARWGRATSKKWVERIKWGKSFGSVGSGIAGLLNIGEAAEQRDLGHTGLALLYSGSGLVGGLTALTLLSPTFAGWLAGLLGISTLFLGLLLFVIGVIFVALVAIFADNEFQKWLEKCSFGKNKYANLVEETEEFQAITA